MPEPSKVWWGRSVWGVSPRDYEGYFEALASDGYHMVEVGVPGSLQEAREMRELAARWGLAVVAQQWTEGGDAESHIESFRHQWDIAMELGPVVVNNHTGKDWFSLEDNLSIISEANAYAKGAEVSLLHETHRGRATYSLPQTVRILEELPETRLFLDLSHWCCVHESLLEDQYEHLLRALKHSDYVHLRVGHTQGSQVSDPASSLWEEETKAHLEYWTQWYEMRVCAGQDVLWSPEFGPRPYLDADPRDGMPLVAMHELNRRMRVMVSQCILERA